MTRQIGKIPLSDAARQALQDRGISAELAEQMGVLSVERGRSESDWIAFRHFVDGGEHDQWTYRTITGAKDFYQDKGGARVLWNNQNIADRQLIITEGHLDALSFMQAGFRNVVSVPAGTSGAVQGGGKSSFDYLDAAQAALKQVKEIVLAVDGDGPGAALHQALRLRLGQARCKFVTYPPGCKDANDVLLAFGNEGLVELIHDARWCKMDGLYQLDDIPPSPPIEPLPTGLDGLDHLWRPARGRLTVLTGVPGHGKGTLITDALCRMAERHDMVIAMASFEDDLSATLTPRLIKWRLGADSQYVAAAGRYGDARQWVRDHFVFISPDEDSEETPTVDWFMERAGAAVIRHNAKMVVLDPWNEMDHTGQEMESHTQYIGLALSRLRRHCRHHHYHLLVTAHPTKLYTSDDGKYAFARGYNIDGSAHWFNKPDSGLTIYRESDDAVKIGCWKCRLEGIIGTRGTEHFSFNQATQRYTHRPDHEDGDWRRA